MRPDLAVLPPRYLRTKEAAEFLSLSARTLEKHRTYGTGPAYRKLGVTSRVQLTLLQSARVSYAEHDRIVAAILTGDAIAAETAMRAHMTSSAVMLERLHGSALGSFLKARGEAGPGTAS